MVFHRLETKSALNVTEIESESTRRIIKTPKLVFKRRICPGDISGSHFRWELQILAWKVHLNKLILQCVKVFLKCVPVSSSRNCL